MSSLDHLRSFALVAEYLYLIEDSFITLPDRNYIAYPRDNLTQKIFYILIVITGITRSMNKTNFRMSEKKGSIYTINYV